MPKAVWTGSLAFGLVNIPVRLYPATEPKDVRFHLMDARGRRVRYRRFVEADGPEEDWTPRDEPPTDAGSPSSGTVSSRPPRQPDQEEEIAYEDLMRGVERDDGSVVLLGDDEIRSVRPERSRTIDIEDFVELNDIDPVYFEKSYIVAPQHGAEKPYALLLVAMERSERAGIGRFVLRTKPHLVAIRPSNGALALETLFFGDEVREARRLVADVGTAEVSERELELAQKLIATLNTTWNPEAYADTYREELLERIAQKEPARIPEERDAVAPSGSQVEALMDALKASVEQAKKKQQPKRSSRARTA
jgi:DNA end-binding protein Ku